MGESGNLEEGSVTEGGFSDGGSTKTGYKYNLGNSPGTGGGSSSICIMYDSPYSRVIVAGGGGGASGSSSCFDQGGSGGGSFGENGASSCNQGSFGKGESGQYYRNCDSGGGGGGGWYGGSGGIHSNDTNSKSGRGGSGWVYTPENFEKWASSHQFDSMQYKLDKKFYLTNASTVHGDSIANKYTIKQESYGNGRAKITPQRVIIIIIKTLFF